MNRDDSIVSLSSHFTRRWNDCRSFPRRVWAYLQLSMADGPALSWVTRYHRWDNSTRDGTAQLYTWWHGTTPLDFTSQLYTWWHSTTLHVMAQHKLHLMAQHNNSTRDGPAQQLYTWSTAQLYTWWYSTTLHIMARHNSTRDGTAELDTCWHSTTLHLMVQHNSTRDGTAQLYTLWHSTTLHVMAQHNNSTRDGTAQLYTWWPTKSADNRKVIFNINQHVMLMASTAKLKYIQDNSIYFKLEMQWSLINL